MSLIKNSFIILFFSLLTLKLSDIAFGSFQDKWLVNASLSKGTARAINLREFNPNQNAAIRPTNYYMQGVENLEQIDYVVNIDKNGFIKTGNPKAENPEIKILFSRYCDLTITTCIRTLTYQHFDLASLLHTLRLVHRTSFSRTSSTGA